MELPKDIADVLKEYINLLDEYFPNTLEEIYLHGSVALGAYEKNSSDIDFITVMNRRLSEEEMSSLASIHSTMAQKYKKPELDGVYIIWSDLREINFQSSNRNGKYQFYNDGELQFGDYFNFNPVTWWILKNTGIKVMERVSKDVKFKVTSQDLVSYVHKNMNSYWVNYIEKIEKNKDTILRSKKIDAEIEWTVLGLLRQYNTIKEEDVVSKLEAGNYGLSHLPSKWHNIIQDAVNIRKGTSVNFFNEDRKRLEDTIEFSRFLIDHSNSLLEKSN